MSIKGVKLKSESFFLVSPAVSGVGEEKPWRGTDSALGMDRVKGEIIMGGTLPPLFSRKPIINCCKEYSL